MQGDREINGIRMEEPNLWTIGGFEEGEPTNPKQHDLHDTLKQDIWEETQWEPIIGSVAETTDLELANDSEGNEHLQVKMNGLKGKLCNIFLYNSIFNFLIMMKNKIAIKKHF